MSNFGSLLRMGGGGGGGGWKELGDRGEGWVVVASFTQ